MNFSRAAVAAVCAFGAGVRADVFNLGGTRNPDGTWNGLAGLETVRVGNPGNSGDAGDFGSVAYEYHLGKYEVTAGQYTEFLNAVAATDPYGLYNTNMGSHEQGCRIQRSGSPGAYTYVVAPDWANRPVNFVSWGDAARFANWLHNGQPQGPPGSATTEDGAYALDGATSNTELGIVVCTPAATWVIPSEDEWYKAAYHKNDGVTGNYWNYPTGSDSIPGNDLIDPDPGNNANFQQGGYTLGAPYWRTLVGEFENSDSPYGTYDQGGNVWEWNEAMFPGSSRRGVRGGEYEQGGHYFLLASWRPLGVLPSAEGPALGFRVARIPEPPAVVALGLLAAGLRRFR